MAGGGARVKPSVSEHVLRTHAEPNTEPGSFRRPLSPKSLEKGRAGGEGARHAGTEARRNALSPLSGGFVMATHAVMSRPSTAPLAHSRAEEVLVPLGR